MTKLKELFEFLVTQQAQFSTDLRQLTQAQTKTETSVGTIANLLSQLAETQLQMAEAQVKTDARIGELAEAQKRTNDSLAETNDRLNSLIVVVERYFSNGRQNG